MAVHCRPWAPINLIGRGHHAADPNKYLFNLCLIFCLTFFNHFEQFWTIWGARTKICQKWPEKNLGPSLEGQSIMDWGQKNVPQNFSTKLNKNHFRDRSLSFLLNTPSHIFKRTLLPESSRATSKIELFAFARITIMERRASCLMPAGMRVATRFADGLFGWGH